MSFKNKIIFFTKFSFYIKVFKTGDYNPAKIFVVFFLVFFIFIFTKGIEVLTSTNSYTIKYDGPTKTTLQRIKDFVK